MPVYRRMCHYNICVHLLFLFALQSKTLCTYSILHLSLENINPKLRPIGQLQRVKTWQSMWFTVISMCILAILTLITWLSLLLLCSGWLVGFVALRPKSTAMVIAGRSVHLTTLFSWAGLNKRLTSNLCTYFRL